MREMALDALVIADPVNILWATGITPVTEKMGVPGLNAVVIPRDQAAPIAIITPQFSYYYNMAEPGLLEGVAPVLYTSPTLMADGVDRSVAADPIWFEPHEGAKLTSREQARRNFTLFAAPFFASLKSALNQQMRSLGNGAVNPNLRLGADGPAAMQTLAQFEGPIARLVPDAVRHCRFVKTPREIALMRRSSAANVKAAADAASSMAELGTHEAVRRRFNSAAGALGNEPRFLVLDGKIESGAESEFVKGRGVLMDAVSHHEGYHGDYGRTVFIGDPPSALARRVTSVNAAWAELREQLRPGMRFSEIRERGNRILRAMDPMLSVPFNPHAVGLAHTEQPMTGLGGEPLDPVLEAGVILSVDMPIMHDDPEGTAHLEDLRLITADGSEPIHADDVPYYVSA